MTDLHDLSELAAAAVKRAAEQRTLAEHQQTKEAWIAWQLYDEAARHIRDADLHAYVDRELRHHD